MYKKEIQNSLEENFGFTEIRKDVFKFDNLQSAGSGGKGFAFGGLLLAQALRSADETVPQQLKAHALQAMYVTGANATGSVECHAKRLLDGRSFASRAVTQKQDGRTTVSVQISYHADEPDATVHQSIMPVVKGPNECPEVDIDVFYMPETSELLKQTPGSVNLEDFTPPKLREWPFHFRCVDLNALVGRGEAKPNCHYIWTKFKFPIAKEAGRLHRLVLLMISDVISMCAWLPHYRNNLMFSLQSSLNHSVHFHVTNFDASEWILMEYESTKSKNGRAFTRGRYWNQQGEMIASVCQEAVIRTRGPVSRL